MNTTPIDDGGAAFPSLYPRSDEDGRQGMSLRDWFAGQRCIAIRLEDFNKWTSHGLARHCYDFADAMIAARNEKE